MGNTGVCNHRAPQLLDVSAAVGAKDGEPDGIGAGHLAEIPDACQRGAQRILNHQVCAMGALMPLSIKGVWV